eukprot:GHVN01075947.1.p1 GENE.GHVN01075947.1~~GHVN01075947.1.p1  ORF type:complete len:358 (+),score=62.44 GHVN01075947.1:560-1633(+)
MVFGAKTMGEDVGWAVELLGDILSNSTYDYDAIEQERHTILREMEEVEKSEEEVVMDRIHMAAFQNSTLGQTILGPEENIRSINRQNMLDYMKRNYTSDQMVLVGTGNVNHDELVKFGEKNFSQFKPSAVSTVAHRKPYFHSCHIRHREEDVTNKAYFSITFEGVPWTSPDAIAFMVMTTLMGQYKKGEELVLPTEVSTCYAMREIATDMSSGCADSVMSFNTYYKDTGLFGFYAQSDEQALSRVISHMMFAYTRLSLQVTPEEVSRAKMVLKTHLLANLDQNYLVAEDIGRSLLVYGRRIPLLELLFRIDAIDVHEIKRVAWKYLYDRDIAVVAKGATYGLVDMWELSRRTYSHRN